MLDAEVTKKEIKDGAKGTTFDANLDNVLLFLKMSRIFCDFRVYGSLSNSTVFVTFQLY